MSDILQSFPIKAARERVFEAVSTPTGLDQWWTKKSAGKPIEGSVYELGFGPDYDWQANVIRAIPNEVFELEMTVADDDWLNTRVGFRLTENGDKTWVEFYHTGWPVANEHFRVSCHCWAMYFRILRRYLEHGEIVAYEDRLDG